MMIMVMIMVTDDSNVNSDGGDECDDGNGDNNSRGDDGLID